MTCHAQPACLSSPQQCGGCSSFQQSFHQESVSLTETGHLKGEKLVTTETGR